MLKAGPARECFNATLDAGMSYEVRALFKEDHGEDRFNLAVAPPGTSVDRVPDAAPAGGGLFAWPCSRAAERGGAAAAAAAAAAPLPPAAPSRPPGKYLSCPFRCKRWDATCPCFNSACSGVVSAIRYSNIDPPCMKVVVW